MQRRRQQMDSNNGGGNPNDINNNGMGRNREELRRDAERRRVIEDVSRELAIIGDHLQAMYTSGWHFGQVGLEHDG